MQIEQQQHEYERVQADLAGGPILPSVTVDEIRTYLASRYHFRQELPLDEVVQDAERMLRTWQVQVTHPRYLSGEAHDGFNKIAHMTGLGRRAVRPVKTDRRLKLDVDSLRRQVRQDRKDGWAPFLVVGTAGTTATGVIDPLPDIAQFCREEGLWFHADAAWG